MPESTQHGGFTHPPSPHHQDRAAVQRAVNMEDPLDRGIGQRANLARGLRRAPRPPDPTCSESGVQQQVQVRTQRPTVTALGGGATKLMDDLILRQHRRAKAKRDRDDMTGRIDASQPSQTGTLQANLVALRQTGPVAEIQLHAMTRHEEDPAALRGDLLDQREQAGPMIGVDIGGRRDEGRHLRSQLAGHREGSPSG